jgi:gluconate 2-dehydrogenase gamma chain
MSDKKTISRRTALKVISVTGAVTALPILRSDALSQQGHAGMQMAPATEVAPEQTPRFFNAQELAAITTLSDLIIPADDHSPGAKAAGVTAFIDLMVSESPNEVKTLWRDGLVAVERISQQKFGAPFNNATGEQQLSLVKTISRNERSPRQIEERFFIAIKGLTVDGYYTSSIGIHQDLQYKGNAVLKEFVGCTHPEHIN